ncbi:protein adenylyltransferase SelO, mitochondrial-like [Pelobates fuscus]|uniref:protein adenylyltransferase SelO, mitochondrial-like n=1 Tax=Pelobates fuscus TaxID=191477 RepID=UPI002FE48383
MTASLDTPKGAGRPPDSPEESIADIGRWPLKAEQAEGNPKEENCTIVLRIAPTFLRFGSFEIFKETDELTGRRGPSVNRNDVRIQMIDYVISTFYPDIQNTHAELKIGQNAAFFREITRRTARLVAEWQCVGFCHDVLNTDNMSIVGITIDYGPYGFMDRYDPDHICNGSENMGRYAYNKQPEFCKWNLGKLAESLVSELPVEISQSIIDEEYDSEFQRWYMQKMRKKLGLIQAELEEDSSLISDLLETMNKTGADFTNTFRVLSKYAGNFVSAEDFLDILTEQYASLDELKVVFKPKMDPRQLSVMLMLAQSNPQLFALIGTKANICKELDRIERYNKLQESSEDQLLSNNRALWEEWLHKYSTRLSKDHATTGDNDTFVAERVKIMDSNNPAFVLRNYIAQNAIDAAEKGDFSEVQRVLRMLENPYDVEVSFQQSPDEAGDEDDELEEEADWIYRNAFATPTISLQESTDYLERGQVGATFSRKGPSTIQKIREALNFMRNPHFGVPFIAFYRKEYVEPELNINDLWLVWQWDEKWTQLKIRKQSLIRLFQKMQASQYDQISADPDKPLADIKRLITHQAFVKFALESYSDVERLSKKKLRMWKQMMMIERNLAAKEPHRIDLQPRSANNHISGETGKKGQNLILSLGQYKYDGRVYPKVPLWLRDQTEKKL